MNEYGKMLISSVYHSEVLIGSGDNLISRRVVNDDMRSPAALSLVLCGMNNDRAIREAVKYKKLSAARPLNIEEVVVVNEEEALV